MELLAFLVSNLGIGGIMLWLWIQKDSEVKELNKELRILLQNNMEVQQKSIASSSELTQTFKVGTQQLSEAIDRNSDTTQKIWEALLSKNHDSR